MFCFKNIWVCKDKNILFNELSYYNKKEKYNLYKYYIKDVCNVFSVKFKLG